MIILYSLIILYSMIIVYSIYIYIYIYNYTSILSIIIYIQNFSLSVFILTYCSYELCLLQILSIMKYVGCSESFRPDPDICKYQLYFEIILVVRNMPVLPQQGNSICACIP